MQFRSNQIIGLFVEAQRVSYHNTISFPFRKQLDLINALLLERGDSLSLPQKFSIGTDMGPP
jgi:hypothetical protein